APRRCCRRPPTAHPGSGRRALARGAGTPAPSPGWLKDSPRGRVARDVLTATALPAVLSFRLPPGKTRTLRLRSLRRRRLQLRARAVPAEEPELVQQVQQVEHRVAEQIGRASC